MPQIDWPGSQTDLCLSLYKQYSLFINKLIHISQFKNKLTSLQTDKNLQTDNNIYKLSQIDFYIPI